MSLRLCTKTCDAKMYVINTSKFQKVIVRANSMD